MTEEEENNNKDTNIDHSTKEEENVEEQSSPEKEHEEIRTRPVETPLPWKPLCIVLLMFIADSFAFTALAPYITNMVIFLALVPDGDKRKIGTWAGIIGSSYYVTQFFSAPIWGALSDRYGRRPVLLLGITGGIFSTLMFGFSTSIYLAIFSRTLYGLVNGNLGTFKVYLAEVSDKTNQARVFSLFSGCFSIGAIIGPLIGGFLADPIGQFPNLKNHLPSGIVYFLEKFPFFPPNFVLVCLNVLSLILGFFYLKESNKRILRERENSQQKEKLIEENHVVDIELNEQKTEEQVNSTENDYAKNTEESLANETENDRAVLSKLLEEEPVFKHESITWKEFILQKLKPENEIYTSISPLIVTFIYATLGATGTMFSEIMPLFLVLKPEDGGLNFTQTNIGILNAVTAVVILLWIFWGNPLVIKKLGCLRTFKIGALLIIPCLIVIPFVNKLYSITPLMWVCLISVYVLRQALYQLQASSTTIMTNNSVTPANMGKLNGISQSAVALTRCIGPSLAGFLFSLSLRVNVFPFNIFFVFIMLSCVYLFLQVLVFPLQQSINAPKVIKDTEINITDNKVKS